MYNFFVLYGKSVISIFWLPKYDTHYRIRWYHNNNDSFFFITNVGTSENRRSGRRYWRALCGWYLGHAGGWSVCWAQSNGRVQYGLLKDGSIRLSDVQVVACVSIISWSALMTTFLQVRKNKQQKLVLIAKIDRWEKQFLLMIAKLWFEKSIGYKNFSFLCFPIFLDSVLDRIS